jgi:hypothetical protein
MESIKRFALAGLFTDALIFPIQDAGLHTWMRTLDIRFIR